jgi:hypothetical protein
MQRIPCRVQAYVKLQEQHTEPAVCVMLETSITVTWMQRSERIVHAAQMVVDRFDPSRR